jgi:uncharacterized protein (TIGR02145 family)
MKNIILTILASSFFISCSKNDSPTSQNQNNDANSLTDADGNVYQTVTISNQTWMKSNLNVSHYRNGDVIPQVTVSSQWANLTTGAWCYYKNDDANGPIYGKMYNWYAVNDPRGLAPVGYHIPNNLEWSNLTAFLGGESIAGGAMKETGTTHWLTPNLDATNSSGFRGLPGNYRNYLGGFNLSSNAVFWSSSENDMSTAFSFWLVYGAGSLGPGYGIEKKTGCSVRCLKD